MENFFIYQYSAQRNKEVEKIRSKYLPREVNKLEQLKKLDFKVRIAGQLQSIIIGIIGSLVFGIGMCFGLDVFGGADWLTVIFCLVGVIIMLPAYPIYRSVSRKAKNDIAPEILRISNEILKN